MYCMQTVEAEPSGSWRILFIDVACKTSRIPRGEKNSIRPQIRDATETLSEAKFTLTMLEDDVCPGEMSEDFLGKSEVFQ